MQLPWNDDVAATVATLRALAPAAAEVRTAAAAIVADVRARGDAAVRAQTARLDTVELPEAYAVPAAELRARLEALSPVLRGALETAAANIRAYHECEALAPWRATLAQGQVVGQEIVPLAAAGLYVPGGLADYPSSVLMTAIPAQVAGVERIVVCSPPRRRRCGGPAWPPPVRFLGVELPVPDRRRAGRRRDGPRHRPRAALRVIVGPGNAYVIEAKRQVLGEVGIDSLAGPSEVLVVADATGEPECVAADLLAQAEHGSGAMACLAMSAARFGGVVAAAGRAALGRARHRNGQRGHRALPGPCRRAGAQQRVRARAPRAPLRGCARAARGVRSAGAVFVGPHAATAFADYAAGTNHVLPTGGSARFSQGLSVDAFRKRVAVVELDGPAASALAPQVATIANEEGLRAHALSARLRAQ